MATQSTLIRALPFALVTLMAAPLAAQEDQPPPDTETPPQEAEAEVEVAEEVAEAPPQSDPNAEQDMQGGGMTAERQLNDEAARQHFRVATRYYDEGRFADAAQQFEEAYELSGRPELLYNAYIAHREANQQPDAAAMLERYLAEVPGAPDRANLEARLAELERAIATNSEQQAALEAARLRADREAAARRQAEAEPEVWPWIIFGVGAAAAIAGAVTGPMALIAAGDLSAQCDSQGLCDPAIDVEARRADAQTLALVTDILLIGGGTIAGVGLILGLVFGLGGGGTADQGESDAPEASAGCDGTGCYATLRGRF